MMNYALKCFMPVLTGLIIILAVSVSLADSNDHITGLRQAEKELSTYDEPIIPFELMDRISDEAKELIYLTVNEKKYYASAVYFSSSIEDKYECKFIYADDTIHIMLSPDVKPLICSEKDRIKLNIASGYEVEKPVVFYTGDPGEILDEGYNNIKEITMDSDNILDITPVKPEHSQILFAIFTCKADRFIYKKYVWVLEKK